MHDVALRNPASGVFYLRYGPDFGVQQAFQWDNSAPDYQALVADFNHDGQADIGLRNPHTGQFFLRYGPSFTDQTTYQWVPG